LSTLHNFLKQKLKEKNISIETLYQKCFISRTTLYRIMKSTVKPTDEVRKNIEKHLNFSESEKHEFNYYLNATEASAEISESMGMMMRNLFFGKRPPIPKDQELEFIYYHGSEKYIKNYSQIMSNIYDASNLESFKCEINIVNCSSINYLSPIVNLLSVTNKENFSVEHLIRFRENDYETSFELLCNIIPLFAYSAYNAFFRNSETSSTEPQLFSNVIFIKYAYMHEGKSIKKFMMLSFLEDTYSDCYVFESDEIYSFFHKNYLIFRMDYQNSNLFEHRNMAIWQDFYTEMETKYDQFLLKPNPCYNKLPISVYDSMMSRYTEDYMSNLFDYLNMPQGDEKTYLQIIDTMYKAIKKRIEATFSNRHLDVYMKNGLIDFAKTGRLSDHLPFLPTLNKQEIKDTLIYLKRRNNDEDDSYKMYIVNEGIESSCAWIANPSGGILCEYLYDKLSNEDCIYNFYIRNSALSKVFINFMANYIPEKMAISKDENNAFIDFLIKEYC